MSKNAEQITKNGYSSSARISEFEESKIDEYISLGYCNTRTRFVLDSIKDAYIKFTNTKARLIAATDHKFNSVLEYSTLMDGALRKLYLEDSGYNSREKQPVVTPINISGNEIFTKVAVDTLKNHLSLDGLQEVVTFSIYLKIKEMDEFKANSDSVTDYERKIMTNDLSKMSPEDIDDFLKRAGVKN